MIPDDLHDFFVASASAAGALIGLLFVALSVWHDRDEERHEEESHALRAVAALTVFTNALAVSLFSLIPRDGVGETVVILASVGLLFIVASGMRLIRLHHAHLRIRPRDVFFLAGGTALFAFELLDGISLWRRPEHTGRTEGLATLVVLSLLFGIARSWELIGGPQLGVVSEVGKILRQEPAVAEEESVAPVDGADDGR